ncbi:response regulator transcription factor [Jatrophihabitans fulvus]
MLVIDDHVLFAEAMRVALASDDDVEVVGVAATLADGLRVLREHDVDVVLLDYRLPDTTGFDGPGAIADLAPHAAVVMVTAVEDERVLLSAIEAGCAGFVTKTGSLDTVREAIARAATGESTVAPDLLARLLGRIARTRSAARRSPGADLTGRERDVLRGIVSGWSNQQIADDLVVSVNTVRNHVQSVLTKLGAHSKLEAAAIATRESILEA